MPEYTVWWGYGITADNVIRAAEQAQSIMQEPGKDWGFKVVDTSTGEAFEVNIDTGMVRKYNE